jgi:hypothetical protein
MNREVCNHCRAAIVWCTTAAGKAMPVDADPDPNGNILLGQPGPDGRPTAGVLGPRQQLGARAGGRRLHLHHRLSCPKAHLWARDPATAVRGRRR